MVDLVLEPVVARAIAVPLILLTEFGFVFSTATLTVPTAGNCGDDTVLTCSVTGSVGGFTGWVGQGGPLVVNGEFAKPEYRNKYTPTIGTSSFTLTIHNTDITDAGEYRCRNGFDESQLVRLNIECKASAAVPSVTNGKRVTVTVDKLYPSSPTFSVTFRKENTDVTIPGSRTCSSSTQYLGYYRCEWFSSNSLTDGSYTYSIDVTTITQADPLTGSFKIVAPQTPVISNTVKLNDSRVVMYGNEGQSLTIQCTSTGGYPTQTVAWYKDSVSSSNQLASASTGTVQTDGTYTVTLKHTFTPTVTDDRKSFICRSYYPQADSAYIDSKTASVIIFLTLKPSQPTVAQVRNVSVGGTVEVSCTTTGSRPAATITWSYQGSTYTGAVTSTYINSTETYTVVSIFSRAVTAADNGRSLQCVVTHTALVSPSERTASKNLSVQFSVPASTTSITGNKVMTATGSATLTLTCTTGSSNPASDITWMNGSDTITSNRPYTTSTGVNNGVVKSQQLVLTPTRYMDGDVITCSVSNTVSQTPVTDTATLNLRYSPLVDIHGQQQTTLTEGGTEVLSCKVDSKPLATITWYHDNIQQLQETPSNNMLIYSLTPVNRTQYGTYRCKANNGINPEDDEQISISIEFKPLTTTITGNSNIIANGQNTLSLVCTSGSSNPISDITWRINNKVTLSTANLPDQSGEYGGRKHRRTLTLRPTRDNDDDTVSCEATNTLGTSARNKESLNLKYHPLIDPMDEITAVEGNNTLLPCKASSKPASTFRWYKQGHSGILHQGTGTLNNNQLTYTKSNVRRTDAGTYRCTADNGVETADEKTVILTVKYPPVVSVVTTNTTIKEQSVSIICNASGIPNTGFSYGKWIQKWPGYDTTLSEHTGRKNLQLNTLTYEHSGVYSCSASNGIKVFGTDKEYMEGSALLLVKSYPIIIHLSEKVSGKLKENVTLGFDYYSNVEGSDVKCYRNENGSRKTDFIYTVSKSDEEVDLPVFSHIIKTNGTRATISIMIDSKEKFGFFEIIVSNEINSTVRTIEIVPLGPPSLPSNVTLEKIRIESASMLWLRGYHGGVAQTFVIEVSNDLKQWRKVKTVPDGINEGNEQISAEITGLHDSTTYYLRMYAFNDEGNSSYTQYINFTTLSKPNTQSPPAALIGGVAGGVSAVVVIVVIGVVVFRRRRGSITKGKSQKRDDRNDRKPVYEDDDDDYGMQDNPMYVSAGPSTSGSPLGDSAAVYSTVDKTKTAAANTTNDVYAEVDKTKKTKAKQEKKGKEKTSKQGFFKDKKGKKHAQEGDIYENAPATELKATKAKVGTNDEIIYENPEPSKTVEKKNVNKDGLIYADLTFNDQPKGQKKLVIHGLDDMTEYVEVDFTKKADPLPDSDDETSAPKK